MSIKNILLNLMAVSISVYTVASKQAVEWLAMQEPILAVALMILMFLYILISVDMTLKAVELDRKEKAFYQAICANSLMLATGLITFASTDIITTAIYKPFILIYCYVGLGIATLLLKPDFSQVFESKRLDNKK
ncbi:hypothetical protein [Vibrio owensii]|uniref:hypothetical protein n=1 Tax=Vibrio owensii TaxID=696485 RepID=UPI00215C3E83|nr:hypothetical protein [Vibrio owensii]MCR9943923.1 hypothetical protein [Vibrio owensii]